MPHRSIQFGPGGQRLLGKQVVYTRVRWSDPWVEDEYLWCDQATWSKAPAMPVASFRWDYGRIKDPERPGGGGINRAKKTGFNRVWVKVVFGTEVDPIGGATPTRKPGVFTQSRLWYGFFDLDDDQFLGVRPDGLGGSITSGVQTLGAYGMERLLATHQIRTSYWDDGDLRKAALPFTFNDEVPGFESFNMTLAKWGGTSHVFEPRPEVSLPWSSADIAEYLVYHQTPHDEADNRDVPFVLEPGFEDKIPQWDKPTLAQEGRTTYSLLNQVIPIERLLMWHVEVSEANVPNRAVIKIDTITAVDVDLPTIAGTPSIPANDNTRAVNFDEDQLTSGRLKSTDVRVVDQVVAQGGLKVSVATWNNSIDDTIHAGWKAGAEVKYEQAGSTTAGYAALAVKDKQKRNASARGKTELEHVFTRFVLESDWDKKVRPAFGAPGDPVFITGDPHLGTDAEWPHAMYSQLFFLQDLPLLSAVDYSGDEIKDGVDESDAGQRLGPLCWFRDPSSPLSYVRAELAGERADIEDGIFDEHSWSAQVTVPPKSRAVDVRVTGAAQYAIAFSDMTRLPVDVDLGQHDWRDAFFTLAITDHRRVEGRSPTDASIGLLNQDTIRRKYLRSPGSEKFEEIYVVPGTIVDVDADATGYIVTSSGGYIRRPADCVDQLAAGARIAAAYYTETHKILSLLSYRHPHVEDLEIGNLVTSVGQAGGHLQDLSTIVTEISVTWRQGDGTRDGNPDPEFRLLTFAGELDAFQFKPVAPSLSKAGRRKRSEGRGLPDAANRPPLFEGGFASEFDF